MEHKDEVYNIFDIFMSNGIVPHITLNERMLAGKNKEGLQEVTSYFLTQSYLMNEDFLLLKYEEFERLIIFDRPPEPFLDESDIVNKNKT